MKYLKYIIITIFVIIIGSFFYYANGINYIKNTEIRYQYVNHPEGLIKPEVAKLTSFGFKNLRANLHWLRTIQYIGGNALSAEYKKYLFAITDLITELNPNFEHPYVIAQLLLPSVNQRYESITGEQGDIYTQQALTIGLKGIRNFCDIKKIEKIKKENNLENIWSNDIYKNPCSSYKIPYYLGFIYFHYLNDAQSASNYYKIASAHDDSIEGAKSLAAIMAGKGGDREKSIFMFLNLSSSLDKDEGYCSFISNKLFDVSGKIFYTNELELNGELIQAIQNVRQDFSGNIITKENEEEQLSDTSCVNFINKAVREFNLAYLDKYNLIHKNETGENALDGEMLLEKGYIDFLPTDFQQYEDYGIKYEFNEDLQVFDYAMHY